ncbi:PaaI family thioesterase [Actinomadura opuntiae]|uniref:PaaI family thioesterase n=1 Tax=Actinomadura sp. OS1-43 TaxID=604315 RepID=UPI00255B0D23|nr:hotdog domain-containing protein [Actinomadura sp. OS1-43]MDL4814366.1 hotdog domain-containing protein [Actinomadura sp. OS1-43]
MTDTSESPHPALAGRERESEALTDAVRRLIAVATATTAPPEETLAAARELEAVADALERHVPDPPLPKTILQLPAGSAPDFTGRMAYDVVMGRHNPLALPLRLTFEPPKALLHGTFTRPYEGPPGCVHGAVIAGAFDILCASANFIAGVAGPTARLEIAYRRPTLLGEPCLFEGEVESQEGKRVRTVGRLVQRGRVTVEATGDFVQLDHADIARMAAQME